MNLPMHKSVDSGNTNSLIENLSYHSLNAETCDIEYWLQSTPLQSLRGLTQGYTPGTIVPDHMLADGPLREASLHEFAFRATTEQMTARNISHLVRLAPDQATMDFFATQLIDEARHAHVFRWHLVELGVPRVDLETTMARIVGDKRKTILRPLEQFALDLITEGNGDFIGGVIFLTVIGEGALAPAAEMSERKWRAFDPQASEISQGANVDEIRHLCVGAEVVRAHLQKHPEEHDRLVDIMSRGIKLWDQLPISQALLEREEFFQAGMQQYKHILGDYELVPGTRLADTTVEERIALQGRWSDEMRGHRLARMGFDAASLISALK